MKNEKDAHIVWFPLNTHLREGYASYPGLLCITPCMLHFAYIELTLSIFAHPIVLF